jgi:hypothetical protein
MSAGSMNAGTIDFGRRGGLNTVVGKAARTSSIQRSHPE